MTNIEEEARAAAARWGGYPPDRGYVAGYLAGAASRVSTPPSGQNPFNAMDEAFREHDAPSWDDDAVARDAAIRWHQRGFLDGMKFAPVPATPPSEDWEYQVVHDYSDGSRFESEVCTREDAASWADEEGDRIERRRPAGPWEPVPAVPAPPREAPEPAAVPTPLDPKDRDPYAECRCGHGRHTHVRYVGSCGLCDCAAVRPVPPTEPEPVGLPIDPNEPKPITTAELDEIRERAKESGDWTEYVEASRRPRLMSREEMDAAIEAFRAHGPGKAANHDRNW